MKLPIIAFACVNYENSRLTLDFCESLKSQRGLGHLFQVICIVVDNSPDAPDSMNFRKSLLKFNWVDYIASSANLGYFGGLNRGMEELVLDDIDFLVLCNNDLKIDDAFCETLCSQKYAENIYAICPDVVTSDGVRQNPHIEKRISSWRRLQFDVYFSHYFVAFVLASILRMVRSKKPSSSGPLSAREVHMGIGACYVLTRGFLNKFKKLHYPNFLYGEEAYFSNQIHSVGGILWFDPLLVVQHAESATLSKIPKRKAYEFAREGYPEYRNML